MMTGPNTTVVTQNYVSMFSGTTLGFARLNYNRSIFTTVVLIEKLIK